MLVDRNCHKSLLHSLIMTGATPIYFTPSRNDYGIIGPIGLDQFSPEAIRKKIAASPIARGHKGNVRLAVVTNSTYDGLCYNAERIKALVADQVDVLHFDEAWYAYAAFHEFYAGRHAMGVPRGHARADHTLVFATQSTHKLLAAFSQASMIHIQESDEAQDRHDALQRRLHDAQLDLAALRHHRLARRQLGDDGRHERPLDRAGDARRGDALPPRAGRHRQELQARRLVVQGLAARRPGPGQGAADGRLGARPEGVVARLRQVWPTIT